MSEFANDYRTLAAEKKLQRQNKIPKEWLLSSDKYHGFSNFLDVPTTCGILNAVEYKITSDYDATALLEQLKAGIWSVEQVTIAFCKRAAIAQQLCNCLTEIFFDEAIQRARHLDQERHENPTKTLPPLYGLPISLKDSFQVMGHDTSTGLACFVNQPAEENSAAVAMLLDLGAILYCKTNLPQSIMTGDSDNNVFGRTLNPHNTSLTAGGSTGGESALLALRGSVLGVGTDIGGSNRVPAVCNGIYGFRPSVGLVPHGGVRDLSVPGTDGVRSTVGPMATSLRDCALFLKSIMQAETWRYDSTVVSVPWRDLTAKKNLRIGLVEDDGVYTPSPPVRRGLQKAADLLRKSGSIEIVPLALPNVKEHYQDLVQYFALLGSENYYELFARTGEPPVPSLSGLGLLSVQGTTLRGFFDLNVRRAEAAETYLKLFRDNRIDAILMPPAPHTAVPLDTWNRATYTGLWNYLDYPAIVFPVDKVQASDLADDPSNAKYGPEDSRLYNLCNLSTSLFGQSIDSSHLDTGPELYKNAPICIQLVGYRHMDEVLVNTATVLDSIINGQKP
ncbi:probable fatty-acid amide hydrolase 1 [Phialocephala subalpina]|uniref:Probable fatty-acid amide hydrolase 1 n=1 Tax=Phialocephala subalpina TaxID=576137 RepID=A0A1L7XZ00_9HELO|nr:probable fatty-acid amide hydrolase 1 [Phialocephala subalpina]